MRLCVLVSAFCVLTSVGVAGMSGTYTIKSDGTGDFLDFQSAANALVDSGMSGDCVFEAYTGNYPYGASLYDVPGNDSWSITFRSAAGEHPVVAGGAFDCGRLDRLALENLTFEYAWPNFSACRDCRITNCRFTPIGDFVFYGCSLFTITGNVVRSLGETYGMLLEDCYDFTIANSFLAISTPDMGGGALNGLWAPRLKLYFNTLWCPSDGPDVVSCLYNGGGCDVRNNVFFLARGCDRRSSCIEALIDSGSTFEFDYNCFYVESAGYVGHVPDTFVDFAGWQSLGYDPHGRYGDPLFVDTSNLHLRQGSPCIGAGVPIPGFEYDIDGDPRDPSHPDIGADEFTGGAVEEGYKPPAPSRKLAATVVRRLPAGAVAFDAMGRRVVNPRSGILFVRQASSVMRGASSVTKVVVSR